jgi:hypothetical protein
VPATKKEVSRLQKALESEYISYGECRFSLLQVESRLQDELGSIVLYSVNQENSEYLSEKPLFGMSVFEAFLKSNTDIMEAGKCLAFERPTAAVLHLMRALEHPLRAMADALDVPIKDNWNKILTDLENKIRDVDDSGKRPKPSYWEGRKEDQNFYLSATVHFFSIKNVYRNDSMHGNKEKYTLEEAKKIFETVKYFMAHLSARLRPKKNVSESEGTS